MAGFLGSLWDMAVARKAPAYYQQQQDEIGRQKYLSLLQQQDQAPLQGPTQDGGLLGNRQLTPQFYNQAAGIRGYEQLAMDAQNNMARRDQNMDTLRWNTNNTTADNVYTTDARSASDEAGRVQNQPYIDAGVRQRDASAYNSTASGNRTTQQMGYDAQLQPGLLTKQEFDIQNAERLANTPAAQTPMQIQEQALDTEDKKAQQKLLAR